MNRKQKNHLDQSMISRMTIPAAAGHSLTPFFTEGFGDKQITNLSQARRLPGANTFRAVALRIIVDPFHDGLATEVTPLQLATIQRAALEFKLNDIPQFESLVLDCPGGTGIGGIIQDPAAVSALSNGAADRRSFRLFSKPIYVGANETFEVNLRWNSGGITLGAACHVFCFLDGRYVRDVG